MRALKHAHAHGGGPKIKLINFELMNLRLFAMKSFYLTSMKYKYSNIELLNLCKLN